MTETIAPTPDDGYGWRMTDSDRLNTHLDRASRRRDRVRPVGPALHDAVAELARRHMANPDRFQPASDEAMEAKEAEIRRERLARQADIRLSRLPSRYREADYIRSPEGLAARQWTESYRKGERGGLVLMGTVGTGKTWLAAAIVRDLSMGERPVPCTFITVADALAHLRPGANHEMGVDMVQFTTAPVLVLDDFGQENRSEWANEQLYRLAHSRSHNALPTIVTTNLSGPEIHEKYEARTVQRLFGGSTLIQLTGKSLRVLPF